MISRPLQTTFPPTVYLVALDESASCDHVLQVACDLVDALGSNAELHIVLVVSEAEANPELPVSASGPPKDYLRGAEIFIERMTTKAAKRLRGKASGHIAVGSSTWRMIVQIASDLEADLVVVGTHGRTGVARFAIGSVAEQVVRHAGCPVLVVRPKDQHPNAEVLIEPPCADCVLARKETGRRTLWCTRHSTHHPHGRLLYEYPPSFGLGSMNFRP